MKKNNTLKYIRIICYVIIILSMIVLRQTDLINRPCDIKEAFGISCPMCGVTRSIKAILNFDFPLAIEMNAYVTLVLFPIFVILFIDDIISIILKKKSFVDIILGE